MKKIVILLLLLLLIPLAAEAQEVPPNIYFRDTLTVGDGSLTALDATEFLLKTGDVAFVKVQDDEEYGTGLFIYFYVDDSAAEVSPPHIYKPDSGTTDGRWIRTTVYTEPSDLTIMESGTDPDVTEDYALTHDTDGAYEGDRIIRAVDADGNQWPVGKKIISFSFPFVSPYLWDASVRDEWIPWYNSTGMVFTITQVLCTSDIETTVVIKTSTNMADATIASTIGTIAIDEEGTDIFGGVVGAGYLDNTEIPAGAGIVFDFDDTDEVKQGECRLQGWYNADVD
jgi:hypothetical protein